MSFVCTYALASSISFCQLLARKVQVSTLDKDRSPLQETCKFAYYTCKELKYYKTQDYPIPFPRCKNKDAPSPLYTPNTPAKHQQNSKRTNRYPPTFYPSIPFPRATHTLGKSRGAEKVGWFPSSFALRRQLRKAPARY